MPAHDPDAPPDASASMDGAALSHRLRSDHQEIASAIDRLVSEDPDLDGASLLATTLTAIEMHLTLEETVLYPRVRSRLSNGESEVIRVMAHAARIEHRVSTLRSPDLSPRQRHRLVADLRSLMDQHIDGHEARHASVVAD